MRKGSKRTDWTVGDERYLREAAGRVPVREICEELGRSRKAVERKAERLGLSLRHREGRTRTCPSCLYDRHRFGKDGVCRVCSLRALIAKREEETREVMARLPPEARATYEATEVLLQSRPVAKERKARSKSRNAAYAAQVNSERNTLAEEDALIATLNRIYKARSRRVERMAKKLLK